MSNTDKQGISVILCCYNSAKRIRETLAALSEQQFTSPVSCEVILVDNASTDQTSKIALTVWDELHTAIPFRMAWEPVPGLSNARKRGTLESQYNILVFCDDDNWLTQSYLQDIYEIFNSDPAVAACGGRGIPVFETTRPEWFDEYQEAYALGPQEMNKENGRILNLYGAGLAIRKNVMQELYRSGFNPIMQGRTKNKLSSAEDTELTYAFVLMGYKLHYDDKLKFYHYLPKERLTFDYLKKLFKAFGSDGPVRNLYYANISTRRGYQQIKNWNYHFSLSLIRLVKYFIAPPKKYGRLIYFNWSIAYIKELLLIKSRYASIGENIFKIKKIAR